MPPTLSWAELRFHHGRRKEEGKRKGTYLIIQNLLVYPKKKKNVWDKIHTVYVDLSATRLNSATLSRNGDWRTKYDYKEINFLFAHPTL